MATRTTTKRAATVGAGGTPVIVVVSPILSLVWMYVTHGLLNAILLSPWNPLRDVYFSAMKNDDGNMSVSSIATPTTAALYMWNNEWSLGLFHVHMVLACLAATAAGHAILELRVWLYCVCVMIALATSGISLLTGRYSGTDDRGNGCVHGPMAALQVVVFVGLLGRGALLLLTRTTPNAANALFLAQQQQQNPSSVSQLIRSASFDARRQLPVPTMAVAVQFGDHGTASHGCHVWGNRNYNYYHHHNSSGSSIGSSTYDDYYCAMAVSNATVTCTLLVTLLLGVSVVAATVPQQKALLAGHAVALFFTLWLYATSPSLVSHSTTTTTTIATTTTTDGQRSRMVGTFAALVLSLLGAL